MPPDSRRLLGGLTAAQFKADYWQRRPLLVRGAWPGFNDPLDAEELAGLACEPDVDSRLVSSPSAGFDALRVRYGPFDAADFIALPEHDWTLLVQDVEKHLPELRALLEPFRFIPDWRVDDLMISYAVPGGTVGPHWDDYDVFLLQGGGRRRWQIGSGTVEPGDADGIAGDELRLLGDFRPHQEWLLERGDMLYLPPRVAHYGVAVEPCLTYSVGFRAPAAAELALAYAEYLTVARPVERYRDPPERHDDAYHPGQISDAALAAVTELLRRQLDHRDPTLIGDWFGRFITDPQDLHFPAEPPEQPLDDAGLRRRLRAGAVYWRASGLRLAYRQHASGSTLYGAGRQWLLDAAAAATAPLLCSQYRYDGAMLEPLLQHARSRRLLLDLINLGYLYDQQP